MKISICLVIFGLGITELLARWWMNPVEKHQNEALLGWNTQRLGKDSKNLNQELLGQISWHPELTKEYQASLKCSSGEVCEIKKTNGQNIHAAMFLWDRSSSVNAIEAFRHRPEQCLGSIGMKLIQSYESKYYQVGEETLVFSHSLFRDQLGTPVHAFKATWVAGLNREFSQNMSQIKEWRELRMQAALRRFKPSSARVVQGAVRSVHNPDRAWEMYSELVLSALEMK